MESSVVEVLVLSICPDVLITSSPCD